MNTLLVSMINIKNQLRVLKKKIYSVNKKANVLVIVKYTEGKNLLNYSILKMENI